MNTEESKQIIRDAKLLVLPLGQQNLLMTLCINMEIPLNVGAIRSYGTFENQLFMAKDVLSVLDLKRVDFSSYKDTLHRVMIVAPSDNGDRPQIALTEIGLMKLLMCTKSTISEKFQVYILIVLKKLMYTGMVTLEAANAEYKKQLDSKSQELVASDNAGSKIDIELKVAKDIIAKYKDEISRLKYQLKLEANPKTQQNLQYLMHQSATPVHVILCKAPKYKVKDPYEYDFEDEDAFTASEVYVFTLKDAPKEGKKKKVHEEKTTPLSMEEYRDNAYKEYLQQLASGKKPKVETKTKTAEGRVVGVVYIHKQENIDSLHELLTKNVPGVVKTDDTYQPEKYATSLNQIKILVNDHYMKLLNYYSEREPQHGLVYDFEEQ